VHRGHRDPVAEEAATPSTRRAGGSSVHRQGRTPRSVAGGGQSCCPSREDDDTVPVGGELARSDAAGAAVAAEPRQSPSLRHGPQPVARRRQARRAGAPEPKPEPKTTDGRGMRASPRRRRGAGSMAAVVTPLGEPGAQGQTRAGFRRLWRGASGGSRRCIDFAVVGST